MLCVNLVRLDRRARRLVDELERVVVNAAVVKSLEYDDRVRTAVANAIDDAASGRLGPQLALADTFARRRRLRASRFS